MAVPQTRRLLSFVCCLTAACPFLFARIFPRPGPVLRRRGSGSCARSSACASHAAGNARLLLSSARAVSTGAAGPASWPCGGRVFGACTGGLGRCKCKGRARGACAGSRVPTAMCPSSIQRLSRPLARPAGARLRARQCRAVNPRGVGGGGWLGGRLAPLAEPPRRLMHVVRVVPVGCLSLLARPRKPPACDAVLTTEP